MILTHFAPSPFLLLQTPEALQQRLMKDYEEMIFEPVQDQAERDPDYQAEVISGISSVRSRTPDLRYAPMSESLMELAYERLTPMMEDWAGQPLQRSWGYGIRSYGPGSWLHIHRDRIDTHVLSCIVHVADQSNQPWPLDFIDHDAVHHQVIFKQGTMLFYESLCPHGRASEFDGDYYRNMYFHWRPRNWDPSSYANLTCKFKGIAEARKSNQQLKLIGSIPATWREWLQHNLQRGCEREGMIERAMAHGFDREAIEAVLNSAIPKDQKSSILITQSTEDGSQKTPTHANISPSDRLSMLEWYNAPMTEARHQPRAWKLDTSLAQIYEIPNFLSVEECQQVIEAINQGLQPSTVTTAQHNYRTSRTCHLRQINPELALQLDLRFARLVGADPALSEPIQGQRYDIGQQFKQHTDWFTPGTKEFDIHTSPGGQRTWTLMVYLNTVESGGETCFNKLGRCFTPIPGMALAWNNLQPDGTPNPFTLHEALPVTAGNKWVITKWFRAEPGRNG